ncbi:hypothetical protein BBP40_001935 [Aspergillus hancockii]|nr:hypothetical protein BBP40_001935 [Aspergillus hancockii]
MSSKGFSFHLYAESNRPTATIDAGIVAGATTSLSSSTNLVNQFLGIPFGAPPVRFSPPQPATSWASVYDASNAPSPPTGESEDCLTLNVFAPASVQEGSKAVLFWLFGGGFSFSTGSLPLYDGTSFAANQDVVVVTINYRTNVFGFPGSLDLPEHLALDWVQRNIAVFGGDPARVTIFGESAVRPEQYQLKYNNPWDKLVNVTKCPPGTALECIRAIPAPKLKDLVERSMISFSPGPDGGATFAKTPRQDRLNSTGAKSRVARTFLSGLNDTGAVLGTALGGGKPELLRLCWINTHWGHRDSRPNGDRVAKILTDYLFQRPAKFVGEESAAVGLGALRYCYNASFANLPESGAYHSSEIRAVFWDVSAEGGYGLSEGAGQSGSEGLGWLCEESGRGPGWENVPSVAVFGAGGGNEMKGVVYTVDSKALDVRCKLYQELYA